MSTLRMFALLCTFLVTTHSSPISEVPEDEKSPLPQSNDDTSSLVDKIQPEVSKVVLHEKNATTAELSPTYCSQFDNSCVQCLNAVNCTMVRYTSQMKGSSKVVEETLMFKCYDEKVSSAKIREGFEDKKIELVQELKDCIMDKPMQGNQESGSKTESEAVVKVESNQTTTTISPADNTTTNVTTKTTTPSNTTLTTATTPTTVNATTSLTTESTTEVTNITTSNPTSSTNATQTPITSKNPPPPPSSGGWSFWSFFGGILLTLGLSAIGFVGFKYYKARAAQPGGGLNYNRF